MQRHVSSRRCSKCTPAPSVCATLAKTRPVIRPLLNAYVSVCPLPLVAGGLPWPQAIAWKSQHTSSRGRATITLTRNKSAKAQEVAALKRQPKEGSRKTDRARRRIQCDQHSTARCAEPDRAPDWPPRIRWPSRQARSACPSHFCLALSHGTQHSQHTN